MSAVEDHHAWFRVSRLLAAINDGIASDEYDVVYEKWFGTAPPE